MTSESALQVMIEQSVASQCQTEYYENKCDSNDRPALVEFCREKHICMNQVPLQSAITLRALSKQIATLINTFTESLTLKSIAVIAMVFAVYMLTHRRQAPVAFPKHDFSVAVQEKSKALALKHPQTSKDD